jgi:hypothetical protein
MSTALSIAFTGLCAIIGNGDGKPGEILLVDARGIGEVGGVALPEHAPTLVVSLSDLANPDSSGPTRVVTSAPGQTAGGDQLGLWDLTGTEVRIRAQGGGSAAGVQYFRPSKDDTSWPLAPRDVDDPASWRDLRFVPHMNDLVGDGRIDPSLTAMDGQIVKGLPKSVAARIYLDSGLLQASMPSHEAHRSDVFEFKSNGSTRVPRQPLTDTVQWTLQSDTDAIVIDIIPTAGGAAKRLLLAPSAAPHRLFVSNLPSENQSHADGHHAMSDEEMAALHFGAYYKLLMNEPADKPAPEPWHDARRGVGMLHSMLCPPAMFTRQ